VEELQWNWTLHSSLTTTCNSNPSIHLCHTVVTSTTHRSSASELVWGSIWLVEFVVASISLKKETVSLLLQSGEMTLRCYVCAYLIMILIVNDNQKNTDITSWYHQIISEQSSTTNSGEAKRRSTCCKRFPMIRFAIA